MTAFRAQHGEGRMTRWSSDRTASAAVAMGHGAMHARFQCARLESGNPRSLDPRVLSAGAKTYRWVPGGFARRMTGGWSGRVFSMRLDLLALHLDKPVLSFKFPSRLAQAGKRHAFVNVARLARRDAQPNRHVVSRPFRKFPDSLAS